MTTYSQTDNSFKLSIDNESTVLEHPILMGARLVVSTDKLASKYFNSTKNDSGMLPPVVRWVNSNFTEFLIERQPFETLITLKSVGAGVQGVAEEVLIKLPWTSYLVIFTPDMKTIASVYVWARPTQIYSENDALFSLPLPNLWHDNRVCLSGESKKEIKLPTGVDRTTHAINTSISAVWDGGFNMDLLQFILDEKQTPAPWVEYNKSYRSGELNGSKIYDAGIKCVREFSNLSQDEVLDFPYAPARNPATSEVGLTVGEIIQWRETPNGEDATVASQPQPFLEYIRRLALSTLNDDD